MARKATAGQRAAAQKLGLKITKKVGGKRVYIDSETLKKRTAAAKLKVQKKKIAAKKRKASNRTIPVSGADRAKDAQVKSSTKAGSRISKRKAILEYKVKDPKTGKLVTKTVRRKNANQYVKAGEAGGKTYTERRSNRTDKGKFL
tara:strand:+ start:3705 stop:4139 length:435 start_codon:yes stop_codon:yes gene_type:complete